MKKQKAAKKRAETKSSLKYIMSSDNYPKWLEIGKPEHVLIAAGILSKEKKPLFSVFGNIIGAFSHPSKKAVGDLNELKGRRREQIGSITTTPKYYSYITDLNNIDRSVLKKKHIVEIINSLSSMGPIGFLLPAATSIPDHLSLTIDYNRKSIRTVQLIVPGKNCPSVKIFEKAISDMPETPFIFATSGNVSKAVTAEEVSAHHRYVQLVEEFLQYGKSKFTIIRDDEQKMIDRYKYHDNRSTTILMLHDVLRRKDGQPFVDKNKRYILEIARNGSFNQEHLTKILAECGFGVKFPKKRLPERLY